MSYLQFVIYVLRYFSYLPTHLKCSLRYAFSRSVNKVPGCGCIAKMQRRTLRSPIFETVTVTNMNVLENSEEGSEVDCREWRSDHYRRKMASQTKGTKLFVIVGTRLIPWPTGSMDYIPRDFCL
jgi:hypothetical protein